MTLYTIGDTIIMKKTISLLLFTLLFTGCVERGYTPKAISPSMAKPITKHTATQPSLKPTIKEIKSKIVQIENSPLLEEKKVVQNTKIITTANTEVKQITVEEDDFFNLTAETKNNISGFFIILIGIIILL